MLKLAGIILIAAGISVAGCFKAMTVKEGMQTRSELYGLIMHIRAKISVCNTPLAQIYETYNGGILEKNGFLSVLKSGKTDAFRLALEGTRLAIPQSLYEKYMVLSQNLGKSRSADSEIRLIDSLAQEIAKEQDILSEKDGTRLVLYRKLGIIAGLLAALILA